MSQLTTLSGRFLSYIDSWLKVAVYMGIPFQHCESIIHNNTSTDGKDFNTRRSLYALSQWLNKEKGTGDLPRTRDTVLKAFKKFFALGEVFGDSDELTAEALQILMED